MNKKFLLMTAALALSLPWAGCSKSSKLDQASTFTPPGGPVELKLKWTKDERIVQEMDMKQTSELSIPGQTAPMKQEMALQQEYGLTVLKESPGGGHEVEMEFLSARVGVPMGSATLANYDSTKKSSADTGNPVAGIFGKIIGSKIQFFLNASNGVERMEGVEGLTEKLASIGPANQLQAFKDLYSEGNLKQMMSVNLILPPKAVQPGDTWPVHIQFPMGNMGTMFVDDDFTFKSWERHGERNCARLEFEGTVTNKLDPAANPTGMSVSITDGKSSGVAWFDPELGIRIDSVMNLDMNLAITLPMNSPGSPAGAAGRQSITDQMNQTVNVKLISVK
jgi:hypothetical protein